VQIKAFISFCSLIERNYYWLGLGRGELVFWTTKRYLPKEFYRGITVGRWPLIEVDLV
jgi:hypothetical protein